MRETSLREAFENAICEEFPISYGCFEFELRADGKYRHGFIREAWTVWLACAKHLEEAVKDAERYRWLRSDDIEVMPGQREINVYMERLPFTEEPTVLLTESALDEAIDAAIAATKGENDAE
jgi:hypothetical protein